MSFKKAQQYCIDYNSNLASIHSEEEDTFIKDMINDKRQDDLPLGAAKQNIRIGAFLTTELHFPQHGNKDSKRMFQLNHMKWKWVDETPLGFRNIDWINRTSNELYEMKDKGKEYLNRRKEKGLFSFNHQQKNNIYNDWDDISVDDNLRLKKVKLEDEGDTGRKLNDSNLAIRPACLALRWEESIEEAKTCGGHKKFNKKWKIVDCNLDYRFVCKKSGTTHSIRAPFIKDLILVLLFRLWTRVDVI